MNVRLYNTLSKQVEPFQALRGNVVRMYSCGPTVYDTAHIGNMRAFLLPDLIQRVLRIVGGFEVRWVMNITDIDDNTIRDSSANSTRWLPEMGQQTDTPLANLGAYTRFFEDLFFEDLKAFAIRREDFVANPRATEYVPQMQALVLEILAAGYGYVSDGSVYFDVAAYRKQHHYGRLFHIDVENFREGVRIDTDQYDRESASDFVLWKGRKEGEPYWDFDVQGQALPGRPGWHIECSAMSKDLLDLPFDIHTGGVDLRFPHHEDELAQCTAGYHVADQARFWVHNEFLEVDGRKMSKSLGNFYTLRDLMKTSINPLDVRMAMLTSHYRSVLNFTLDGVKAASASRSRIQDYIWELRSRAEPAPGLVLSAVEDALADDLHTPRAFAELFTFIKDHPAADASIEDCANILGGIRRVNDVFSLWSFDKKPTIGIPAEVQELATARWNARLLQQWAESDRLRNELANRGWSVLDGKDGYQLTPLS